MGPRGRIGYILHILDCWDRYMQVLYLGRALRTKKTLPDFLKWRRVTRHPLVFRGLTGSQWTPGFGASHLQQLQFSRNKILDTFYISCITIGFLGIYWALFFFFFLVIFDDVERSCRC